MMSGFTDYVKWFLWPLRSRKVVAAVATVIVAWAVQAGCQMEEQQVEAIVMAIVASGLAVVGGIALEDHGAKSAKREMVIEDKKK